MYIVDSRNDPKHLSVKRCQFVDLLYFSNFVKCLNNYCHSCHLLRDTALNVYTSRCSNARIYARVVRSVNAALDIRPITGLLKFDATETVNLTKFERLVVL